MANIPLQSISFPGLSDKYTTPTVDATLTQTGAAADAKKTGDEIGAIKNDLSDGTMTVNNAENAEQLTSTVGIEDTTPYLFRTSGGSVDIGDREDVKKIAGGTIVNNQLVGTTDTSITVQSGHKAYKSISGTTSVFTSDGTAITVTGGTDIVIDLTQMLGTSIADYVLSIETATAGAGVAWLKKHFPAQFDAGYQAYDAGSLQSVSGLAKHKMVGFNQFNSEAGTVRIIGGMQYQITGTYTALSLDGTTIAPDSNGKFTPTNSGTLTVTGGNATDTCVHFVWDGEKDGEYEPYKTWSYALDDSVTLRGIPKVDASGNLYYDGDEYLPDGTVNRRLGIVNMGTLGWVKGNRNNADTGNIFYCSFQSAKKASAVVCTKYTLANPYQATWENLSVNTMEIDTGNFVAVCSTEETVADFKTAVTGVPMLYELATPTTETALPYQETQIVDDFGTEEFVLADGAFPVPVGHNTMYQNNLRAKLEMSPDSPDGDGLYVVQQESGENTYVPLASTATIQDILTRLTALENA